MQGVTVGQLAVDDLRARVDRRDGQLVPVLSFRAWLAPFDLGVTQRVIFSLAYVERLQSYQLTMQNVRLSGQDTNWVTTNKPFLERLRTYLMHWRNLDAAQHGLFAQTSQRMFAPN